MPLVELPGFTEAKRRHKWAGSRALAIYEGDPDCRRCHVGITVPVTPSVQHALFYHGGYGAGERVTARVCLTCGSTSVVRRETVRPPR